MAIMSAMILMDKAPMMLSAMDATEAATVALPATTTLVVTLADLAVTLADLAVTLDMVTNQEAVSTVEQVMVVNAKFDPLSHCFR